MPELRVTSVGRGTANAFCAVEPKAGRHFSFPTPDRSAFEFARVASDLAMQYPDADTIHLVMDNLNIHCSKSPTDAFETEVGSEIWDRFTVYFTPTRGRWLNQAEIEIGLLSRQRMNGGCIKINWKFDGCAARRKFGYKRNSFKRSQT
jgi:hypothetical protein